MNNILSSNFYNQELLSSILFNQSRFLNLSNLDKYHNRDNKEISKYQSSLKENVISPIPSYPNLYFALNSYNQNLKRLRTRYPESTLAIIKIVYDETTLNATKIANSTIEPAKVIVVYDLSGNVINPGIVLTEDLVMQTTSDAMYDSERTILDNIYRTLIIKKSPNKIFYLNEDNKTYTLLDYQTNFIYKLEYDKKTHYFLTYQHAWLYLREIIALEAQRVSIKG